MITAVYELVRLAGLIVSAFTAARGSNSCTAKLIAPEIEGTRTSANQRFHDFGGHRIRRSRSIDQSRGK
jgi:hypothetical protein